MKSKTPSWIRVLVVFFIIFALVEYIVDSGDQPAFMEYPAVLLFLLLVLCILIAIEAIVGTMRSILYKSLSEEERARVDAASSTTPQWITWMKGAYSKLLDSRPIEEEHEIILDHNYDGIRELNNNLPPWWLYGFYITIIFGAVYLVRYHILDGPDQVQELETELAEARIAIEEYKKTAKNLVDINTVTVLTEVADLQAGKAIWTTNCVACHMADGGGGIGPNMTDEYWILGGGIKNIFKTISEGGRDGKGMIAWKTQLKPLEMAQVASYVMTLEGTTSANPKAAEGEIWVDPDAPEVPAETAEVATDSLQ